MPSLPNFPRCTSTTPTWAEVRINRDGFAAAAVQKKTNLPARVNLGLMSELRSGAQRHQVGAVPCPRCSPRVPRSPKEEPHAPGPPNAGMMSKPNWLRQHRGNDEAVTAGPAEIVNRRDDELREHGSAKAAENAFGPGHPGSMFSARPRCCVVKRISCHLLKERSCAGPRLILLIRASA